MTYTGTSDEITINSGWYNICLAGGTLNTKVEFSPDNGSTWFPLQEEIETDRVITSKANFNILLPSGLLRFNGGTSVTAFALPLNG